MNTNISLQLTKGINKNPSKNKRDFSRNNSSEEVTGYNEESVDALNSDLAQNYSDKWLATDDWLKYYNFEPKFI